MECCTFLLHLSCERVLAGEQFHEGSAGNEGEGERSGGRAAARDLELGSTNILSSNILLCSAALRNKVAPKQAHALQDLLRDTEKRG